MVGTTLSHLGSFKKDLSEWFLFLSLNSRLSINNIYIHQNFLQIRNYNLNFIFLNS